MKKYLLLTSIIFVLFSCDNTSEIKEYNNEINILPQPKEISISHKGVVLSEKSKIYFTNNEVLPLLALFKSELQKLTGITIDITPFNNYKADIIFKLDCQMSSNEYRIETNEIIKVTGGSYQALTMAKSTLLQLVEKKDNSLMFPQVNIRDFPDAKYRGLMIDLARQWHSVETIKKIIELAAFYKVNYLQLHFSDYQSYTLPSIKYPNLSTSEKHYSFEELNELEEYSQQRGVTIIPEIDIPGHSSPFVEKYPEIFAIKDTANNPWIINMGKEEVYEALDIIIGEVAEVFKATPYFHIGGDEAIFYKVDEDPDVQLYVKEHNIGEDVHELYRHFLVRMNDIVKKHNKQMCVWEGFRNEGKIEIPKDIVVFEFETNRYLPNLLVNDGYTVVNTSWKPLYVVNNKKWEPRTIYNWNLWRWENWFPKAPSFNPIQVENSPLVIGAQMCAWEQAGKTEIPSLRKRLPAFLERIWNTEKQITYEQFFNRLTKTDIRLSKLIDDDRQDDLLIDYNFVK